MITSDFHIHSSFSTDSESEPVDIIKTSIDKGLKTICITDHMDCYWPYDETQYIFAPVSRFEALNKLKDQFKDQIDLRIGMELGLRDESDIYEKLLPYSKELGKLPFDFIIGSTHLVDYDDPYFAKFWEGHNTFSRIMEYYEATLFNAQNYDDFDVYGHIDYIARYLPEGVFYEETRFFEIIVEILKTLISKGKGIEINTKSLSKGVPKTNPDYNIVKAYKDLGGEIITIGSDSHKTQFLGYGFDYAEDLLKSAGFDYYTIFKNRKPEFVKL